MTNQSTKSSAQITDPSATREYNNLSSVADSDPGSGAFLTPGSGMGKNSGSGSTKVSTVLSQLTGELLY